MISVDSMRALWAAVLYRAVEDAKRTKVSNDHDFIEQMKVRESAIKWIFHENEDIRGFDGLCMYLNIDANTIRRSEVMQEAVKHYMEDSSRVTDIYEQRKVRALSKSERQRLKFLEKQEKKLAILEAKLKWDKLQFQQNTGMTKRANTRSVH